MKNHVKSYKDLPCYVYQIQTKFRNELRPKSGIMRCREFLMKDLYSFSRTQDEHNNFYEKSKEAYMKIFTRLGLGEKTYLTFASGGVFSKYSHEFQTLSDAGEDLIYVDKNKKIAINKEVYSEEILTELGLEKNNLIEEKAIEVGNIFSLGKKYSEPLGLKYLDEEGKQQSVIMGSYGIGPGRVMGAIVEVNCDDKGMIWPKEIAPYQIHLISLAKTIEEKERTEEIYQKLLSLGQEVLFDDRENLSAGQKFADSDLIGIPLKYIVSTKTLAEESIEIKERKTGETKIIKIADLK